MALAMSFFSVWVGNRMPVKSSIFLIFFGIINAGYLIFQLLLTPIFRKILLQSHSISITFAYAVLLLPLIGQLFYAYLIISIRDYFKNRNKSPQAQGADTGIDDTQQKLYSIPSMPSHAFSLTKEVAQMKILRSPGFIGLIVVLLLVLVGNKLLFGQPKLPIVWTPRSVEEIVLPNSNKTVNVSFRANINLTNVTFFLSSAIRNIVSVSPVQFASITIGQTYQVAINIHPGTVSQVKYQGTLQLKDNLNRATNALPLPITVVVHNEPVPPDPGDAGKQTLEGIDSDNDGVRDDIQRWIVINYLTSEKRRAALRQYIKVNQIFLVDANDKELSRLHADDRERATECSFYVFGFDDARRAILEMKAQFLNTEARSEAFIRADSQLSGTFSLVIQEDERKAQCSFDPDTMVN